MLQKLKKTTPGASRRIYEYIPYRVGVAEKLKKSRPGASRRIYEYIPYQNFLKSLGKVDTEFQIQGIYKSTFLPKCLLKAYEK